MLGKQALLQVETLKSVLVKFNDLEFWAEHFHMPGVKLLDGPCAQAGGGEGGAVLAPAYNVFYGGRVKVLYMGFKPEIAGAAIQLLASDLDVLQGL